MGSLVPPLMFVPLLPPVPLVLASFVSSVIYQGFKVQICSLSARVPFGSLDLHEIPTEVRSVAQEGLLRISCPVQQSGRNFKEAHSPRSVAQEGFLWISRLQG